MNIFTMFLSIIIMIAIAVAMVYVAIKICILIINSIRNFFGRANDGIHSLKITPGKIIMVFVVCVLLFTSLISHFI